MIRAEVIDGLLRVTLARPEKRNALTPGSLEALASAFRAIGGARACVLAGEGPAFCAGFDLPLCAQDPSGRTMRDLLTGLNAAIRAMREAPVPVVASVHGSALAGGCALLGGCDLVVADRSSRLGYPVVRIGVSPAVSAPFLVGSVADGRARSMLLHPEPIDADSAHRAGLVDELRDSPDAALARAIELARTLAAKPGIGMRETRALCQRLAPRAALFSDRALDVSRSLTGSDEERTMLGALWAPKKGTT